MIVTIVLDDQERHNGHVPIKARQEEEEGVIEFPDPFLNNTFDFEAFLLNMMRPL